MTRTRNHSIIYLVWFIIFVTNTNLFWSHRENEPLFLEYMRAKSSSMLMQHFVRMAHGNFFYLPHTRTWRYEKIPCVCAHEICIFWWKCMFCFEIWKAAAASDGNFFIHTKEINHSRQKRRSAFWACLNAEEKISKATVCFRHLKRRSAIGRCASSLTKKRLFWRYISQRMENTLINKINTRFALLHCVRHVVTQSYIHIEEKALSLASLPYELNLSNSRTQNGVWAIEREQTTHTRFLQKQARPRTHMEVVKCHCAALELFAIIISRSSSFFETLIVSR